MSYDWVHDVIVHCSWFESIKLSGVPKIMAFILEVNWELWEAWDWSIKSSFFMYKKPEANIQAPPASF